MNDSRTISSIKDALNFLEKGEMAVFRSCVLNKFRSPGKLFVIEPRFDQPCRAPPEAEEEIAERQSIKIITSAITYFCIYRQNHRVHNALNLISPAIYPLKSPV
jgi:hypothetical protein